MTLLSIIIVSYNTKKILDDCLNSIYGALKDDRAEIIVVDNNSTDGTKEMLQQKYPGIKSIINKSNRGFGAANNEGMAASKGKFILLLNSDTIASERAINGCLEFISKHPRVKLLGCRLIKPDGRLQLSCGRFYTLWNSIFGGMEINALIRKTGIKKSFIPPYLFTPKEHEKTQDVDWVSAAFMLLRREVFEMTGGFDEKIFLYEEEHEWCYRIKRKKWRIVYYPSIHIIHLEKASMTSVSEMEIYKKMLSGKRYFFQKHYGLLKAGIYKNLILLSAIIKLPIWCIIYIFSGFKTHPKDRIIFQTSSIVWYFLNAYKSNKSMFYA